MMNHSFDDDLKMISKRIDNLNKLKVLKKNGILKEYE